MRKSILLYQQEDKHTEIFGCFIHNLKNHNIYIYHPAEKTSPSSCIQYYDKLFGINIKLVEIFDEAQYDVIFIMSSPEIENIKPFYKCKYVLVTHNNKLYYGDYVSISVTPLVKGKYHIIPIYPYQLSPQLPRENKICIVGIMRGYQRDKKNIELLLQHFSMYNVFIFTKSDKKEYEQFEKYPNCKIMIHAKTEYMLKEIQTSKFIYMADTKNYYHKRIGVLSGMMLLGLNNSIPLIMSNKLNNVYKLDGVLTYENHITELNDNLIKISNGDESYNQLVELSKKDNIKINKTNAVVFDKLMKSIK